MGNTESSSGPYSGVPDDSSLSSPAAGLVSETESSVSSEDCYQDVKEETLMCSSLPLFTRKNDPLLLHSPQEKSTMKRSASSLSCYPSSAGVNECSPKSVMPRASSWTSFDEYSYTLEELNMHDGDLPTVESDLRPSQETGCRNFWVVTTASIPWMTGTAVNPLLRAAHLSKMNREYADGVSTVTLVIPWLESPQDRVQIYGDAWEKKTCEDQDAYIRTWLAERAGLPLEADLSQGGIQIQFYPARLHSGMNSIFPMGDSICSSIPAEKADVCFLEEPEHLNWYRAPGKDWWSSKFNHVVGIGHTNYKAYVREHVLLVGAPIVGTISSLMVRAYCHKLIKLSGVLQTYAPEKEVVMNVHGIRSEFLKETPGKQGIYFIGKLLWAKGFDKLIDLQTQYRKETGEYFEMDVIGSGPEELEIQRAFQGRSILEKPSGGGDFPKSRYEFRKHAIPATFVGRRDHAECRLYKIFVNASITEVLCTTTAEAIAMGKFVIVPAHPSNDFFVQFPNCLQYSSKKEFVTLLRYALTHDPEPLTPELKHLLTWEAATERCLEAAAISRRDAARLERIGKTKSDHYIAKMHYELGKGKKGDVIRKFLGGGPVSDQVHYETTLKSVSTERS